MRARSCLEISDSLPCPRRAGQRWRASQRVGAQLGSPRLCSAPRASALPALYATAHAYARPSRDSLTDLRARTLCRLAPAAHADAGALAFVSARLGTNCQRLLRYILHACNLPAGLPKPGTAASEGAGAGSGAGAGTGAAGSGAGSYLTPVLRDRDALFLPAGADTLALVNDLRAGQGEEADRPFEAVVPPPPAADTEAEEDDLVEALEEAAFLRSLQEPKAMAAAARAAARAGGRPGAGQRFETGSPALALAASPVPASMRTATPPASLPSGSGSRHLGAGGGVPLAGKRGGSGGGGAEAGVPQNQEAIASFFQGLLSRSNSGVPDATARRAPAARRVRGARARVPFAPAG